MKAAVNISHGTGSKRVEIYAGQDIPDEFLDDIPEELVLENVPITELSREQLLILAGKVNEDGTLVDDAEESTEEMTEGELREALGNFGSKVDIYEWWTNIRPDADKPSMKMTRPELEDWVVNTMFEEADEDE